jgi:GNAT superfamily N-acetyltransferase
MNLTDFRTLPEAERTLLDAFYRSHGSRMKVSAVATCWVAGLREIRAGLCLTAIDDGYWLTGLLVAPEHRNQGLASSLVRQAMASVDGPVWLFCKPPLEPFYQRLGFAQCQELPPLLTQRLERYRRTKQLIAMGTADR